MGISSYSTTPASNTTINSIDISEGCAPSGINNAIRQLMADIATDVPNKNVATNYAAAQNFAQSADIASATTTDIGAATGNYVNITGTTTITGLGTIQAGTQRKVKFTGILTLTYNAASLILPGAANITTAAGDTADFVSLGSGNWICTGYQRANGSVIGISITAGKTLSASNTITLAGTDGTFITFQATDTYVGRATTDTLTNKTFDTAGTGNVFKIAGTSITSISGNTAKVATTTGALTSGNLASFDASGNIKDSGVTGGVAAAFAVGSFIWAWVTAGATTAAGATTSGANLTVGKWNGGGIGSSGDSSPSGTWQAQQSLSSTHSGLWVRTA